MTQQINDLFPIQQFFDPTTHLPLDGGKIYSYLPTTLTPSSLYTNYYGDTKLPNPITLGIDGMVRQGMWFNDATKIIVKTSSGTTVQTYDNVTSLSSESLGYFTIAGNIWSVSQGDDIIFQTGGTGTYTFKGTSTSQTKIDLSSGIRTYTIQAPASITSDRVVQLPDSDGTIVTIKPPEYTSEAAYASLGSTLFFISDTYPTKGNTACVSKSYTPSLATNTLIIDCQVTFGPDDGFFTADIISLFMLYSSRTGTVLSAVCKSTLPDQLTTIKFRHVVLAGQTTAITFETYLEGEAAVFRNGIASGRVLGGVISADISILEITI